MYIVFDLGKRSYVQMFIFFPSFLRDEHEGNGDIFCNVQRQSDKMHGVIPAYSLQLLIWKQSQIHGPVSRTRGRLYKSVDSGIMGQPTRNVLIRLITDASIILKPSNRPPRKHTHTQKDQIGLPNELSVHLPF